MTTPNTQLDDILTIAQGCEDILRSASNIAEKNLVESVRPGSDEALAWAAEIETSAVRIQQIAAGLLEIAQVAVIPAAEDEFEGLVEIDELQLGSQNDTQGNETEAGEAAGVEIADDELADIPLDLDQAGADESKADKPSPKERKLKPRYSERQLEVVERIVLKIKPGEEFRQSQLNAEDFEGLTDSQKQNKRSFYSSVLAKLLEDGLIGHNGKQRGGSKSILEDVNKLEVLIAAEGFIDGDGKPIPEDERFVQNTKKADGGGRKVQASDLNPAPKIPIETPGAARERRNEERRQNRQAAIFSVDVVSWIAKYLEGTSVKAPTVKRVGEAIANELRTEKEVGVDIVRALISGGVVFDHKRYKGSRIIGLDAPSEEEVRIRHLKKDKADQARLQSTSRYGEYFADDDVAFKQRYGEVKGVRKTDVNFERGVIKFVGIEKMLIEHFYDTQARSAVAYKNVTTEIARKYNTEIKNAQLERSVEIINMLAGTDFFVLMAPATRASAVKGPRIRMQGSFMDDSHARS